MGNENGWVTRDEFNKVVKAIDEIKKSLDAIRNEMNNINYKNSYAKVSMQPATLYEVLTPHKLFGDSRVINSIYEE